MIREPLERKNGRFVHELSGLDDYAKEVAEKLCEMYPNTDVIDIEFLFQKQLSFEMSMKMAEYSVR